MNTTTLATWVVGNVAGQVIVGIILFIFVYFARDFWVKQNQKKLRYSKIFCEKDLMFRVNDAVKFCDANGLELCVKEKKPLSHEDYSIKVDEHLKQGYSKIWEYRIKRDTCIKAHNNLAKQFLIDVTDSIKREFDKKSFSDWNSSALVDICKAIQSYYNDNEKMFDFNTLDMEQSRRQIFRDIILDYLSTTNFPYYKNRELPYNILDKPPFNKLKDYKSGADKHNTNYVNGINKIIQDVRVGNPLKGYYDFEWYVIWWYKIWHYIKK